jgi:hypothetical protein
MKNLIAIIILTLLIFIPIQFVDYYDGGTFGTGLPLSWDSSYMGTDSASGHDIVINELSYWVIVINFVLVFIVASLIWPIVLFVKRTADWWVKEIKKQIQIEKKFRTRSWTLLGQRPFFKAKSVSQAGHE